MKRVLHWIRILADQSNFASSLMGTITEAQTVPGVHLQPVFINPDDDQTPPLITDSPSYLNTIFASRSADIDSPPSCHQGAASHSLFKSQLKSQNQDRNSFHYHDYQNESCGTNNDCSMTQQGESAQELKLNIRKSVLTELPIGIEALKNGGVIALPTDTIYGVAALAQNKQAIHKVYDIKRRVESKPLAICVGSINQVHQWCEVTIEESLLDSLLPGPVTLVFQRKDTLNSSLNPGTSLVGIRIPDYPFIQALCNELEEPLALTSANISNGLSPTCIEEFTELWPRLGVIYDGGILGNSPSQRLGSTVVNLSRSGYFSIIRPGSAYDATRSLLLEHGLIEDVNIS